MEQTSPKSKILTDRLLRSWIRCRRKAWLDLYGNKESRAWTAHRTLQLDHQHRSFIDLMHQKPGRGLEALIRGEHGVVGLRLKGQGPQGQLIEAHPQLLQKINGQSIWGNFAYRPVIARQGRRITREHRLSLALTGFLLESIQGEKVAYGLAVCKSNKGLEKEKVFLKEGLHQQLIESLIKLDLDLKLKEAPPITTDRKKCTLCSWRSICNAEAKANNDLSEVSGVGARRRQILQDLGIKDLNELATTNPSNLREDIARFGEQHKDIAKQLVQQARVQKTGIAEKLCQGLALPELSSVSGVLLYDIESDPDDRDDFLHGFLSIHKKSNGKWDLKNAKYHPVLVLLKHGESLSWKRLNSKLNYYPNWPVLHYGETEALSIYRMGERNGAETKELRVLKNRFIDIHDRIRKNWCLPLNSYGLKTVANWTGFHWTQSGADGARALLWWRQWKAAKGSSSLNSTKLKKIFEYNKDDCLATWKVTEWLLRQDTHATIPEKRSTHQ